MGRKSSAARRGFVEQSLGGGKVSLDVIRYGLAQSGRRGPLRTQHGRLEVIE